MLGPNSLGVVNGRGRNFTTFASVADATLTQRGFAPVALVSQSGAIASYLVDQLHRAGSECGLWVATGNECDVDAIEVIDFLATREDIGCVLVYLEGVRDGGRLRDSIRRAVESGNTVGILKAGRSPAGAAAVASHTAAVAGEDRLFDAVVEDAGGIQLTD